MTLPNKPEMPDKQGDAELDDLLRGYINTWYRPLYENDAAEEDASDAWVRLKSALKSREKAAEQRGRNAEMDRLEVNSDLAVKGGYWQIVAERKEEIK